MPVRGNREQWELWGSDVFTYKLFCRKAKNQVVVKASLRNRLKFAFKAYKGLICMQSKLLKTII
jgi:hypothetical protein